MEHGAAVYIHIPFCRSKCGYCDFASFASLEHLYVDYVKALMQEIDTTPPLTAKTIYLGGGTPSLLPVEMTAALTDAAKKKFRVQNGVEITIEANPSTITTGDLKALRDIGINRLSIGIQSFNEGTLKILGRGYSHREAAESLESALKAGFNNVSIDIMTGVPGQTEASMINDLEMAVGFSPEHLSVYQLTLQENSPMHEMLKKRSLEMPGDDVQAALYEASIEFLDDNGYLHYEVSNFARPGMECLHNLAYWLGEDYLGLGSGAHSFLNGRRFANPEEPEKYIGYISNGAKQTVEDNAGAKDELINYLLMRLRLVGRKIEFAEINRRFGLDFQSRYRQPLEKLDSTKLLELTDSGFGLTRRGLLFLNNILLEFI